MQIGSQVLPSCTSKIVMCRSISFTLKKTAHLLWLVSAMDDLDNDLARSIDDQIDEVEALPFKRETRR
jgi:hypothetical protein